jgi:Na+/melibiose symporter-like transporter
VASRPEKEFTVLEGLAFCLAAIANQLSSEFIAQWGNYYYSPTEGGGRTIYVAIGSMWVMFFVGRIFDAFIDPLIGVWTDETRSRPGWRRLVPVYGRRRPFIFWGSILMTFTGIAYWYPPFPNASKWNLVYGTVLVCLHFFFFTLCLVPMLALAPEIARSKKARVSLGAWIAVGMVVGLAIGDVLPGMLVELLDPARAQTAPGGVPRFSPVGYQRTAIIFSVASLVLFQFLVWAVKERADSAPKRREGGARTVFKDMYGTLLNSPFVRYVVATSLFSIGYLATQRVLPNWAEVGLGGSEETVTKMMVPFIVSALLTAFLAMPVLSRFFATKWLLVISFAIIVISLPMMYPTSLLHVAPSTKFVLGGLLFAFCGIGQGMQYVLATPIIGEIIDLDEQRTGRRREGAYNGMYFIGVKGGQALSIVLSNILMSTFGNSVENPLGILLVGPFAGLFALLGLFVILTYPVLHVTRETAPEPVTK